MSFTNPNRCSAPPPPLSSDADEGGEMQVAPAGTIKYHGALAIVSYEGGRNGDGEMDGEGKCVYAGGAMYTGQFHKDNLHVIGTMIDGLGNEYSGEWCEDMRHGKALFGHSAGVYEGHYCETKRHGRGKEMDLAGNIFEGAYERGNAVRGKMSYENGDVYIGELNEDEERHGEGKFINADTGEVLVGRWENDEFVVRV
jgi:hypothetical protein